MQGSKDAAQKGQKNMVDKDALFVEAQTNVLETLTKEEILSVPGVIELVLEDCNNAIMDELGELEQEALDAQEDAE